MKEAGVLTQIARSVLKRVEARAELLSLEQLQRQALSARKPFRFREAFVRSPAVLAEVKFASPSQGEMISRTEASLTPSIVARQYLQSGAVALSILTEEDYFKGSLSYLNAIRREFPEAQLLMKDFVVSERQIYEARVNGADSILLIVALLENKELTRYFELAGTLGLSVLVEVHDEEEMRIAHSLGAELIGVNSRNLKTLEVSLATAERLAAVAPKGPVLIAESGIQTSEQIKKLNSLGYQGFLIGTSLMQGGQPGLQLRKLLEGMR